MARELPMPVTLRPAGRADEQTLLRLAALDSAPALRGEVLLACVEDDPRAALALSDGRVVADPFHHTADLVALLRLRAAA